MLSRRQCKSRQGTPTAGCSVAVMPVQRGASVAGLAALRSSSTYKQHGRPCCSRSRPRQATVSCRGGRNTQWSAPASSAKGLAVRCRVEGLPMPVSGHPVTDNPSSVCPGALPCMPWAPATAGTARGRPGPPSEELAMRVAPDPAGSLLAVDALLKGEELPFSLPSASCM